MTHITKKTKKTKNGRRTRSSGKYTVTGADDHLWKNYRDEYEDYEVYLDGKLWKKHCVFNNKYNNKHHPYPQVKPTSLRDLKYELCAIEGKLRYLDDDYCSDSEYEEKGEQYLKNNINYVSPCIEYPPTLVPWDEDTYENLNVELNLEWMNDGYEFGNFIYSNNQKVLGKYSDKHLKQLCDVFEHLTHSYSSTCVRDVGVYLPNKIPNTVIALISSYHENDVDEFLKFKIKWKECRPDNRTDVNGRRLQDGLTNNASDSDCRIFFHHTGFDDICESNEKKEDIVEVEPTYTDYAYYMTIAEMLWRFYCNFQSMSSNILKEISYETYSTTPNDSLKPIERRTVSNLFTFHNTFVKDYHIVFGDKSDLWMNSDSLNYYFNHCPYECFAFNKNDKPKIHNIINYVKNHS